MWSSARAAWFAVAVVATVLALPATANAAPEPLVGTFRLAAGSCGGGAATGSYLRMILPTGDRGGPFLANADSACGDQTFTLLAPGSDGGLVTGSYQPEPSPGFDGDGNSLAGRITAPTGFFGVSFAASTNATDPQTGGAAPAPSITVDGSTLSGDLSAFAASWNDQEFNQGAPKPGGGLPGNTAPPWGTFDAASGAFTLEWSSQVEGGPFDRFTGLWHLEGTFVPATAPAAVPGAAPSAAVPAVAPAGTGSGSAPTAGAGPAVGAVPGGASAGTTPTSIAAATASPAGAAAPTNATSTRAAATAPGDDGWAPPGWLVALIAVVTLAAFGTYVHLEGLLRRLETAS